MAHSGITFMRWCVRVEVPRHYPEEIQGMRSWFDQVLCFSLHEFKRHDRSASEWWKVHGDIAKLVLPAAATEACFRCDTQWADVQAELREVVASSQCGRLLFAQAMAEIGKESLGTIKGHLLTRLRNTKSITMGVVGTLIKDFKAAVAEAGTSASQPLPGQHVEKVPYMGYELKVSATSQVDMFETELWAYVKSLAVLNGQLTELWGERRLAREAWKLLHVTNGHEFNQCVLDSMTGVRALASGYINDPLPAPERIREVLSAHGAWLTKQDARFRLERAFFTQLMDGDADSEWFEALKRHLPSAEAPVQPKHSLEAIVALNKSPLHSFATASVKVIATAAEEHVRSVVETRICKQTKCDDDRWRAALSQMALWCSSNNKDCQNVAPGAPTARVLFQALEKAAGLKKPPARDVRYLASFAWLLSDAQRRALSRWLDECAAPVEQPKAASSAGSSNKGAKAKKGQGGAKATVAALFSS
jgi:hypothetical protein